MTEKRLPASEEAQAFAAEYAIGLLEGADLDRARHLEREDDQFRAEVARWRGRFAPLAEEIDPVSPPAAAWSAISGSIGFAEPGSNVVQLRRDVRQWRAATAAMTALAACLAVVLIVRPLPVAPPTSASSERAPMVAMLGADRTGMKVVASWDPAARQLVLAVSGNMPPATGASHELWVIPSDGKPRSLGVMPAGRQMHMKLADALAKLLQEGATIAISVEPRGGSPTGKPTGPVVAAGPLQSA